MSTLGSVLALDLGDAAVLAGVKQRYTVDFGIANAGAENAPTWVLFRRLDTNTDLTPPEWGELAQGLKAFDWDWSTSTATSIVWKATLNGLELFDVIWILFARLKASQP